MLNLGEGGLGQMSSRFSSVIKHFKKYNNIYTQISHINPFYTIIVNYETAWSST